jgi:hypothetical protein
MRDGAASKSSVSSVSGVGSWVWGLKFKDTHFDEHYVKIRLADTLDGSQHGMI